MATPSTSTPSSASPAPTGAVGGPPLALADTDPTEGQDTSAEDPSPLEPAPVEPTADPSSDRTEGVGTALRAERRRANQLEKEIRTLRQQLNRFSEINPEEYARLQEAERQKQALELQIQQRERQMEEASAKKVAAVAAERDEARAQVLQLRKDRLLERAFSQAEGRTGGDKRGTFFDIFKGQLGECFPPLPAKLSPRSDRPRGLQR